jgi:hypothetical protein
MPTHGKDGAPKGARPGHGKDGRATKGAAPGRKHLRSSGKPSPSHAAETARELRVARKFLRVWSDAVSEDFATQTCWWLLLEVHEITRKHAEWDFESVMEEALEKSVPR